MRLEEKLGNSRELKKRERERVESEEREVKRELRVERNGKKIENKLNICGKKNRGD